MPQAVHDQIGHMGIGGDIKGLRIRWGYRFGMNAYHTRIVIWMPEQPYARIVIASFVRVDPYPV